MTKILPLLEWWKSGGGSVVANALTFADSVTEHTTPDWEIQDRVQCNNLEANVFYDAVTGRQYNSGYCKPYSPKYQGMGGMYYYHPEQGFYDAIIDDTERGGEPDYHVSRQKPYVDEDGVMYTMQENMHAQDNHIWRSNPDLNDFQKIFTQADPDTARGMPYRTTSITPGTNTHIWIIQKQVAPGDVSTLAMLKWNGTTYESVVDIVLKGAAGHRVYGFKPFGNLGPDENGKFWIYFTDSSSEANYELFEMYTTDWVTFRNRLNTHSFTAGAGTFTITTARDNGYKVAGEESSIYNLGDHCEYVEADGTPHIMYMEDYHNELYYIKHNGTTWEKILLNSGGLFAGYPISSYTDKDNPYEITSTPDSATIPTSNPTTVTVTVGTGVSRLTELINVGGKRVQLVKGSNRIVMNLTSYDPVTGVMEGDSTGLQEGSGTLSGWSVRTAGVVDGVTNQFVFVRNEKLYVCVRVILPDTYRRLYLFESSDFRSASVGNPPTFTFVKDLTPGITNVDVHKSKLPENINEFPDNENFVIWSCKAVYDSLYQRTGTNWCLECSFGTITATERTFDATPYTNRAAELTDIGWRQGYSVDDVVESGGSITQVTDITGNGKHITPNNAAVYKQDGAIKTYGSGHLPLPNPTDFRPDTAFSLMCVARKIGNSYLISGGHPSDVQQYMGIKTKVGGSVKYNHRTTAGAIDEVDGYIRLIGDEYAIIAVTSNGKHLRFYINGIESNKSFSDDAPKSLVRWFNYLNTNLNNVLIGARISGTTNEYTPVDLKEWRYKGSLITYDQRTKLEKTWAAQYGITLGTFGTDQTYEPEVHTTAARMNVAPSSSDLTMYNDWVVGWKNAHGLPLGEHCLSEVADLLNFSSAHDEQASLLNFARPFPDASKSGSPIFTQYRGWKSSASGYINTNFYPAIHSRAVGASGFVGIWTIEDVARGTKTAMGLSAGTNINVRLQPRLSTDVATLIFTATTGLSATSVTDMRAALYSWRSSTSRTGQRNTTEFTATSAVSALLNAAVYLLCENDDGVASNFLDANVTFPKWGNNTIDEDAIYTLERNILVGLGVTGI